jgi:hypothetical protein
MWSAYGTAAHCGAIAKRATGAAALAATIAVRTQCGGIVANDERGTMAIGTVPGMSGYLAEGARAWAAMLPGSGQIEDEDSAMLSRRDRSHCEARERS